MRRRIVEMATVLLTFPVAACGPDPARPPTEYRLLLPAADFWSGSQTVILVETLPPPDGPSFELFLDGQPVEAESTEPASIVVRLPEAPGEHQLSATIAGGTVLINHETIRLHGFRDRVDYGPLKGTLRHWPAGSARVLGIGPTGPALLDLRTGVAMRWADSIGGPACNLGGLGPSWRPDHFVMQGRTGADSSTRSAPPPCCALVVRRLTAVAAIRDRLDHPPTQPVLPGQY